MVFCLENWDPSSLDAPKDKNNKLLNHLNVGTGLEISIKELANTISKITRYCFISLSLISSSMRSSFDIYIYFPLTACVCSVYYDLASF